MRVTRAEAAALHIHAPPPQKTLKRLLWCLKCKRRRWCAVRTYEWYEPSATCRTCKRKWVLACD